MTAMNSRLIYLTDGKGRSLLPEDDMEQPLPGSILMTNGRWGTAWQRRFSDGRWMSISGQTLDWDVLITKTDVVLVYDADERPVPEHTRNRGNRPNRKASANVGGGRLFP